MSLETARRKRQPERYRIELPDRLTGPFGMLSLVSMGILTASYLSVLWWIGSIVEAGMNILIVAGVAMGAAILASRWIRPRTATVLTVVLLVSGTYLYLQAIPEGLVFILSVQAIVHDFMLFLSGVSLLNLTALGHWATAFTPAPIFLSWYLFFRGRYTSGAVVGGSVLGFLILTGDAGTGAAIAGVIGLAGTVVLGELDRRAATVNHLDMVAIGLAVMVVGSLVAATALGSAANPLSTGGEAASLEGSVVGAESEMAIVGAVELSPTVRYTIESEQPAYWRSDAYDRYTGGAWIQTGEAEPLTGILDPPPGPTEQLDHTVVVEDRVLSMPAAWKPREVITATSTETLVSPAAGIGPDGAIVAGDRYRVLSERPAARPAQLRGAGTDYPSAVEERYTQLPDSTPERVGDYTAALIQGTDSPVGAAERIEDHLRTEKSYSLDVERPEGDIADGFLFEMDAGYCTYFATTMVVMLRTQGIPARMAVGYTPGEYIGDDRYVVRGLDAHAWVEMYVPGAGWISFDPTPPQTRTNVHGGALDDARADEVEGVDTPESAARADTSTYGQIEDPSLLEEGDVEFGGFVEEDETGIGDVDLEEFGAEGTGEPSLLDRLLPDPRTLGIWLVIGLAVVASARRTGVTDRGHRWMAIRWQGLDDSPNGAVDRAYRRLEIGLENRYRDRDPTETHREFIGHCINAGADPSALTVLRQYERVRYGSGVDAATAAETIRIVDEILDIRRVSAPVTDQFNRQ